MKKLFTILLILVPFICPAQEAEFDDMYNFKMVNNGTVWQYVYKTDKPDSEILKYFVDAKLFQIDCFDSTKITGIVIEKPLEYQKYKFTSMGTPIFISNSNCSYNIDIEVKDSRYRVTISQVMFALTFNMKLSYLSTNDNQKVSLDLYSYDFKRNRFKPSFSTNRIDKILATIWYNTYLMNDDSTTDNNW